VERAMNNTKDHSGIVNVLSLLLALFLIKEYYAMFDVRNVKNVYSLLQIRNPPFLCAILILVGARSVLQFAKANVACLIVSEILIYYLIYTRTYGIVSCNTALLSMINFMKLYSYIAETRKNDAVTRNEPPIKENNTNTCANVHQHERITEDRRNDVPAPEFTYFIRFLFLPTLCFLDATRYRKRSVSALFYNLIMASLLFSLVNFLVAFYIIPLLECYTIRDFVTDLTVFVRISATSFVIWVAMFLFFFKYYLSFLAECTNYENKIFGDWWNARYFRDFWRLWNIPTHEWLRRYVFFPCYRVIESKWTCTLIVFVISSILHEIVYILTFKKVGVVVFMSILSQFVFIYLEQVLFSPGNLLFWFVFCFIGQPVFLLSIRKRFLEIVLIKA
ncbi:Sterol O-acyltransferase/Diacylglycerol O-acyltransferase, partial [Trachipleistophora hominis]